MDEIAEELQIMATIRKSKPGASKLTHKSGSVLKRFFLATD